MNRRLLLLVNSPALVLGLVLIGTCAVSLWAINSLQEKMLRGFHSNVTSLRAARDMEVAVRELRFDTLLQLLEPNGHHDQSVRFDRQSFDAALRRVRAAGSPEEGALVTQIEKGYRRYRAELEDVKTLPPRDRAGVLRWVEAHPVQHVVGPCRELLDANERRLAEALRESLESGETIRLALFVLGAVGPLGGLICGYAIHRALGRSIARLQVRVQDVHEHITPEVGVVELRGTRNPDDLHGQLDLVLERVRGLVERLQTQQRQIVRSEQLAMVGRLASSLAHEIRNPLTAMKWLVEAAARSYPDEPLSLDDIRVLQSEIERVEGTVQGMLDFVRPAKPKRCDCDLREVVRQVIELTRARKRQLGVTCRLDLPAEPVVANVDPGQMKSVLVNLLLNALDAMPHGGQLTVRLRRGPGAEVSLAVEDTGGGIAPEVLERLFVPFTSTKANGTGLGLSVARRIVEEHGGSLAAENRSEGGARFTVTLPER
jgi:two-component system, NtrC family, sensor histidine kinase HydH